MLITMVVVAPIGITDAAATLTAPVLLAAAVGVGICSSVIPYVCDQLAMARIPRATFALMLSLLPATAVIIGLLVLGQGPTWLEATGIALVILGVALHRQKTTSKPPAAEPVEAVTNRDTGTAAGDTPTQQS